MHDSAEPVNSGRIILPLKHLLKLAGGGLIIGAFMIVAFILPAEYGRDPLGTGARTGLNSLGSAGAQEFDGENDARALAVAYETPMRSDVVHIPLTDFLGGAHGSELEYKVAMKKGATLVYSFEVKHVREGTGNSAGSDNDLRYDFHGHTLPKAGEKMTVVSWGDAYGSEAQGALTAPFDGIQGWQFSKTGELPMVVHLRLSGFYTLIEPGQEGNLAGIVANVPASEARPGGVHPPSTNE
ncbi:MAG: hypothetical protein FJ194_07680 [Gammaproteobacteria bacterium]|nr:hypothetical protein [Gammaproteobacteria bacterium]